MVRSTSVRPAGLCARRPNPLAAVVAKQRAGRPVSVVFFGGSITWGGNCSDIETHSYRALVGKWLRGRLGGIPVTLVNAGMGGTGSDVGCYRLDEHVLSHAPDLVFIEFAINDQGASQAQVEACVEAVLRRLWGADPKTGVIVLISGSRDDRQAALLYRSLADRFGLHCVDVGAYKRRLIRTGRETDASLFADAVHPSDRGHAVYARCVLRVLGRLWRAPAGPQRQRLPRAFFQWRTTEYLGARMTPALRAARGGAWQLVETQYTAFNGTYPVIEQYADRAGWPYPYRRGLLRATRPGSYLEVRGRLHAAGLSIDYRKGRTEIEVNVDGQLVNTWRMDLADGRFPRYPETARGLDGKPHVVRFVLRKGSMYVGYVLTR